MPREKKPTKAAAETPFQRFQRLARKLANVPKDKVKDQQSGKVRS